MASFDVAKLLNKITQDIPGINTALKALAKWDVSALTDVPDGAMQATTDTNNRLTIKKKVSGSYTPVTKLMHDVDTVDGYHASTGATANTVAVRDASGALPGNILGNAATANTATALATGTVVPINQGGTGATTASQARANLGVANGADFTAHIAKQASPSVEGHVKLDALAANGSNTAAPGGFGLGMPEAKQIPANTDLDSIVLPGFYSCKTNSAAGQLLNCPTDRAFSMLVEYGAYGPTQTLHTYDNARRYRRTKVDANSFSGWEQVPGGISDSTSTTSSTIAASATAVKAVSDSLGEVRVQGAATWSLDGAPYPISAQVYHGGKQWLALRANSVEPSEGNDWSAIGTAATKNVGTSAGNVMEVGAFGLGNMTILGEVDLDELQGSSAFYYQVSSHLASTGLNYPIATSGSLLAMGIKNGAGVQEFTSANHSRKFFRTKTSSWGLWRELLHTGNLLQTTGSSTDYPMSQKAVTDALVSGATKQVFKASGTYTAKETGPYLVICIGGGGGGQGGARDSASFDGGRGQRHGDVVYLKKNVEYPVVIGGGGQGGIGDFNKGTAGAAGGASSFGTNIVYSAGGLGGAPGGSRYGNRIGWAFSDLDTVLPIPADGYGAGGAQGAAGRSSQKGGPGQAGSQGLIVVFSMGEV